MKQKSWISIYMMKVEQFRELLQKRNDKAGSKNNKYKAVKTSGHASKKEHARAITLNLMLRAGLISNLREQVCFILIPAQRDEQGRIIEHRCAYVADFVYNDKEGNLIVEDTKGFRTKEYIIKRKLMLRVHNIRITEI